MEFSSSEISLLEFSLLEFSLSEFSLSEFSLSEFSLSEFSLSGLLRRMLHKDVFFGIRISFRSLGGSPLFSNSSGIQKNEFDFAKLHSFEFDLSLTKIFF